MAFVHCEIVEHDGGWAYKVGNVYSEPYPTHDEARNAAKRAAAEQQVPGETTAIGYQDEDGRWHDEVARGQDRSATDVKG